MCRSAEPETIGNSSIRLFELLFSNSVANPQPLSQLRRKKYDEMVSSDRKEIDLSVLPPSPRAAFHHSIRVYHQIRVSTALSENDMDALMWGWTMKNGSIVPIATDAAPAPQNLLEIFRCSCKGSCGTRCFCRKNGLECAAACNECL